MLTDGTRVARYHWCYKTLGPSACSRRMYVHRVSIIFIQLLSKYLKRNDLPRLDIVHTGSIELH